MAESGGVAMGGVPDEDAFESESEYGLDGFLEQVDAWNKLRVNIAVINSFFNNIITVCYITN